MLGFVTYCIKGKISLRDYQQHLQMTLQMGPDKMLAALPGFSNMAFPSGANPSTQIKRFLHIMVYQ